MTVIVPVILSGGSGTRLWPLSTEARPKQFHALDWAQPDGHTLFRQTLERFGGEVDGVRFAPPVIIGNAAQADLIERELDNAGIAPLAIVLEPEGRHTAAAAATAAAVLSELHPGALALLASADHVIRDVERYRQLVALGAGHARDRIVTFGIVPDRPETGYGYIEVGDPLGTDGVGAIRSFTEKPDAATAARFLAMQSHLWNAGMFLFAPEVMLEEFSHATDVREDALAALKAARREGTRIWLGPEFRKVRSVAVDIAVMHHTRRGAVVPCSVGWADVGSWSELWRLGAQGLGAQDPSANFVRGDVVLKDSEGALVLADGIAVAALGLKDMVVVATPEAVLILPKDRAQDVKQLREEMLALKAKNASPK